MILLNEKQIPFISTICRVLCISLSFFWPALAISSPASTPEAKNAAAVLDEQPNQASEVPAQSTNTSQFDKNTVWDLSDKTDPEINQLVRRWPHLNPAQRRDLLAEVRVRMSKARAQSFLPNKGQKQSGQSDIEVGLSRAQRQYRYGQSIPRQQQGTVVITAKVTRTLPDGTRVTQSTVTPVPLEELRNRSINGSAASIRLPSMQLQTATGERGDLSVAAGSSKSTGGDASEQKTGRQVFRATVRFGAGFGRRDADAAERQLTATPASQNAQQISASLAPKNAPNDKQNSDLDANQDASKESKQDPKYDPQQDLQQDLQQKKRR
ncbi:MAG: hypothetical protein ACI883_000967 [Candidatus Azotimanducaceae bacterium]|jgi:hypothetical protein|tara:strand:- start:3940 stop:4911 length:972 start_codon:yes stop_codon:yes gene_type:complete